MATNKIQTNIELLPAEILEHIFESLCLFDLESCLDVCLAWRRLALTLCESKARTECEKILGPEYEDAQRRSGLSWRELHNSLTLWKEVKSAKMKVYSSSELKTTTCMDRAKRVQFMDNGVIAIPTVTELQTPSQSLEEYFESLFANTLTYYKSERLEHIDTVHFDFSFTQYEENGDLIVFRDKNKMLRIITKADKNQHVIGNLYRYRSGQESKFFFVRHAKKVFYINSSSMLCEAALDKNGTTIQIDELAHFDEDESIVSEILTVTYIGQKLIMLNVKGYITTIRNNQIDYMINTYQPSKLTEGAMIHKNFKFDWSDPAIAHWINNYMYSEDQWVRFIVRHPPTVHGHANVALVGTVRRLLNIYYDPFKSGQLRLTGKSALKVDLNIVCPLDLKNERIMEPMVSQIGVIEIKNGHRVVMLYCNRFLVIELTHDSVKRPAPSKNGRKGSKKSKK